MVLGVRDVDVAVLPYGYSPGGFELALAAALRAPTADEASRRREVLDAVVAGVDDVNVAVGRRGYAEGPIEFSFSRTGLTRWFSESPTYTPFADATTPEGKRNLPAAVPYEPHVPR